MERSYDLLNKIDRRVGRAILARLNQTIHCFAMSLLYRVTIVYMYNSVQQNIYRVLTKFKLTW